MQVEEEVLWGLDHGDALEGEVVDEPGGEMRGIEDHLLGRGGLAAVDPELLFGDGAIEGDHDQGLGQDEVEDGRAVVAVGDGVAEGEQGAQEGLGEQAFEAYEGLEPGSAGMGVGGGGADLGIELVELLGGEAQPVGAVLEGGLEAVEEEGEGGEAGVPVSLQEGGDFLLGEAGLLQEFAGGDRGAGDGSREQPAAGLRAVEEQGGPSSSLMSIQSAWTVSRSRAPRREALPRRAPVRSAQVRMAPVSRACCRLAPRRLAASRQAELRSAPRRRASERSAACKSASMRFTRRPCRRRRWAWRRRAQEQSALTRLASSREAWSKQAPSACA